jgi:hypothetical protein
MCTLITSKGTDIDENIANQNHATRTRTPKPGYLNLLTSLLLLIGLQLCILVRSVSVYFTICFISFSLSLREYGE